VSFYRDTRQSYIFIADLVLLLLLRNYRRVE